MRSRSRGPSVALATLLLAGVFGSSACTESGDDAEADRAAVYSAVIRAVVADRDPGTTDAAPPGPVFVASRPDEPIVLEVQVDVVVALESWATVRFIDELDEAVHTDDPAAPVREDGILLTLGGLPEELGPTVAVEVHVHTGPDAVDAYQVEVSDQGGVWEVSGPLSGVPQTLPPEE